MREKLQTLSLVVLREFAKDKKIKGITAMRKAELIDAIIEASGGGRSAGRSTGNTEYTKTGRTPDGSKYGSTGNTYRQKRRNTALHKKR